MASCTLYSPQHLPNPKPAAKPASAPAAYFITFICYGARLHGDEKGSVDRFHNDYGARFIDANPHRLNFEIRRMKSPAELLDAARGKIVLQAIIQHANYRGWNLHAAHVRSNHIVVQAPLPPEKVMTEFKAYATRALNQFESASKRRWADHGSTRYLWDIQQLDDAVNYVVNQQGNPMALYSNPACRLSSQQPHPQRNPERK